MALAACGAAAAAPPEPLALSMQVDPQRESCFYEEVSAGWEIDATALVYRGGQRACARARVRLAPLSTWQAAKQPAASIRAPTGRAPSPRSGH